MKRSLLVVVGALSVVKAYAERCIKVRDASEGYTCLSFNQAERGIAAEFHLELATPYKKVLAQMSRAGWRAKDESCGQGFDAVCELQMTKRKATVSLTFSATNDGTPLIGVEKIK